MKSFCYPILLLSTFSMLAQWRLKDPFEQKVFIENKGQYAVAGKLMANDIYFGASQSGLQYYFTKNAVLIKHSALVKRNHKEIEAEKERLGIKETEDREEKEFLYKKEESFHEMRFTGGGINTNIEVQDEVSWTYHFAPDQKNTLKAKAWRKLMYKNLYPGVDMEFYFPEDKQGFKYNFILHPGADITKIKIEYPDAEGIRSQDGNVHISSSFGLFTDHQPVAFQNGEMLACSFDLKKDKSICFVAKAFDLGKKLVIDPWTTTPIFTGGSNAYDVDWDFAGNCYVYGGTSPFQLMKIDTGGNILWTFTTSFTSGFYYGDFTVDKNSGSTYIVDGFDGAGAQMQKVNKSGTLAGQFPGNSLLQEMWRAGFDQCNNKPVIAGGGTTNPSYTGCTLDTNLATVNPVNVINSPTGLHDMWGLALDSYGNAYFATAQTQIGSPGYDNIVYKVPNPSLSPITYSIVTTFKFIEVASVNYAPGPPNGFNGMTVADTNLFLYDSYVLSRYNTTTGVATGSVSINGTSQATMTYGGLASDGCGTLFLGHNNMLKQYDATLSYVTTYTATGTVYDVSYGNGVVYACGQGFVQALTVTVTTGCNPCSGIGIEEKDNPKGFTIAPNPAGNLFTINFPPSLKTPVLTIYNCEGRKIRMLKLYSASSIVSLQDLSDGFYILELDDGKRVSREKLIKSNN